MATSIDLAWYIYNLVAPITPHEANGSSLDYYHVISIGNTNYRIHLGLRSLSGVFVNFNILFPSMSII